MALPAISVALRRSPQELYAVAASGGLKPFYPDANVGMLSAKRSSLRFITWRAAGEWSVLGTSSGFLGLFTQLDWPLGYRMSLAATENGGTQVSVSAEYTGRIVVVVIVYAILSLLFCCLPAPFVLLYPLWAWPLAATRRIEHIRRTLERWDQS